jgi:hypothetical protein
MFRGTKSPGKSTVSIGCKPVRGNSLLDRLGPCPAVEDPLAKPVFACIIEPFRSRGPLGNRAWVLQERLLSPRTLEFTRHGLRWQCDSSEASEMRPLERPVGVSSYNWNPIVHKIERLRIRELVFTDRDLQQKEHHISHQ